MLKIALYECTCFATYLHEAHGSWSNVREFFFQRFLKIEHSKIELIHHNQYYGNLVKVKTFDNDLLLFENSKINN